MDYIGSKKKLITWIIQEVENEIGDLSEKTFCDLFSGTGIVARSFAPLTKKVIANDLENYSYVINQAHLKTVKDKDFEQDFNRFKSFIEALAEIDVEKEIAILKNSESYLFLNQFSEYGKYKRKFFTIENAYLIDKIRQEIETYRDRPIYYYLLMLLLENADRISNVASVYGAFLKHYQKVALKNIAKTFQFLEIKEGKCQNVVNCGDANKFIEDIDGDILYLDPPYNHRQYAANYHVLIQLVNYQPFESNKVTGLTDDYNRSAYCQKKNAKEAFQTLIEKAQFETIFLSYNNEGILSQDEIVEIMNRYGEVKVKTMEYQRYKADKDSNRIYKDNKTTEYLFILKKLI